MAVVEADTLRAAPGRKTGEARAAAREGIIGAAPGWAWAGAALLLIMPALASDFVLYQIFGWSFVLGMVGLSLMFLGGYGGMVSLAQMSVAGMAGYMTAIFGVSAIDAISLGWPWWMTVPTAILIAVEFISRVRKR